MPENDWYRFQFMIKGVPFESKHFDTGDFIKRIDEALKDFSVDFDFKIMISNPSLTKVKFDYGLERETKSI